MINILESYRDSARAVLNVFFLFCVNGFLEWLKNFAKEENMKWCIVIFGVILSVFLGNAHTKSLYDDKALQQDQLIPVTTTPKSEKTTPTFATTASSKPEPTVSVLTSTTATESAETNDFLIDKLSNQIRQILKHFQDPDPVGLPGDLILPEPMEAANVTASLIVASGFFYNITIHGLNNFTVSVVNAHLDQMEVFIVLRIRHVTTMGNYSISNLLTSCEGPFNITLHNVTAVGTVSLATDEEGRLYANKSAIDMSYDFIQTELTDVSNIVLPFVSSGGSSVLEEEKPLILENINRRLIFELNRRLRGFPKIPGLSSLSPVDLAVLEGRKFVKARYEPFNISKIFALDNSFLKVNVGPVLVYGLSKFARVGNITLMMANQTVELRIRIITGRLMGNCKFFYDIGKVGLVRDGQANFSIDHLQFEAKLKQPIDSRKPPVLEELEIETGQILVKMDGHGSLDYFVEVVVKLLPKMLRHMVIDALEEPVKMKIQEEVLNKINLEQVYEENLPDIKKYLSDKL